jgi:hypothetical protein
MWTQLSRNKRQDKASVTFYQAVQERAEYFLSLLGDKPRYHRPQECSPQLKCCSVELKLLTWPVPVEGARVIVRVDGARRIPVHVAMDWQVAVARHGDALGGPHGVVVDGLRVGVGQLGEHAAASGLVPLLGSDVLRS